MPLSAAGNDGTRSLKPSTGDDARRDPPRIVYRGIGHAALRSNGRSRRSPRRLVPLRSGCRSDAKREQNRYVTRDLARIVTRNAHSRGSCWPTPQQTLLLRAVLLTGAPALEAFQAWRGRVNLDRLDRGSFRLLPLLAHNLRRHEVQDPIMARLEEVCRDTRSKNVALMERLATLLAAFSEAGLETMILKGAALLVLYYSDPGLRPMSDLDLLVRTDKASGAMALLRQLGWTPQLPVPERVVPVTHSHLFQDRRDTRLDLHWHLCWECCGPGADDAFWAAAQAVAVDGVPTSALCRADQLLHATVHGVAWNPVPPLRWVADAMLILQAAGPSFEWSRLLTQARHLKLILPLREALAFMRDTLDAPVPDVVLATLRASQVSRFERFEYRARIRPWGWYGALPRLVCHYLRLSGSAGQPQGLQGLRGFPRYLQHLYGLARLRDLPSALWARLLRNA